MTIITNNFLRKLSKNVLYLLCSIGKQIPQLFFVEQDFKRIQYFKTKCLYVRIDDDQIMSIFRWHFFLLKKYLTNFDVPWIRNNLTTYRSWPFTPNKRDHWSKLQYSQDSTRLNYFADFFSTCYTSTNVLYHSCHYSFINWSCSLIYQFNSLVTTLHY